MPSWSYFVMIILGGSVVVIANTLYPLAKSKEDKREVAQTAKALIDPEIEADIALGVEMQQNLKSNRCVIDTMSVAAWETISKGNLLTGFDAKYIGSVMRFYKLVYDVNELNAKLIDMNVGVMSALTDNQSTKNLFNSVMERKIEALVAAGEALKTVR